MSDQLVLEARLRARDEGLVGQLNATEQASRGAAGGLNELSAAAKGNASATSGAAVSDREAARAARELETARKEQERAARAAARAEKQAADEIARAQSRLQHGRMSAGNQVQDFFIQVEGGTPILRAFSQQASQLTGAIALMSGEVNGTSGRFAKFANFMAGPWGVAIGVAIPLVTLLAQGLFDNAEASEAAEAGANGLAAAQSTLGQIFDTVSGKLKTQNELLIINARLQAISLRAEAAKAEANAKSITDGVLNPGSIAGAQGYGAYLRAQQSGSLKSFTDMRANQNQIRMLVEGVGAGRISRADAVKMSEGINFENTGFDQAEVVSAFRDGAVAELNRRAADLIEQSLDSGKLAAEFRTKGPKGPKGRSGAGAARALENFGDSADEKIQRIADGYNPAPRGMDKAFADLRALDGLIADLGQRKPPSFEKLIAEAKDARGAVLAGIAGPIDAIQQKLVPLPDGIVKAKSAIEELDGVIAVLSERKPPNWQELVARARDLKEIAAETVNGPLNDMVKASREHREQQLLILQGREREAEVLGRIKDLEARGAPLTADQRREVEALVDAEGQINDLLTKRQDILAIYMAGIGDLRSALEDLFTPGSGGDFLKDTERMFKQMSGRLFVESIFGDSLRALEKKVRGETPLDREIGELTQQVDGLEGDVGRSGKALRLFTESVTEAAADIRRSAARPAHNLGDGETFTPTDAEIVVTGTAKSRNASIFDAQKEYARAITGPITAKLDDVLGTSFFRKLEPALAGGLAGFWTAGPVGGLLGAVRELPGLPDKLKDKLGTALEGAQTGVMVAGIGKMLGIKTSSTGGAIGGAIGSVLPIPGGEIIGSIAGSLLGGLFSKTKKGSATITSIDGDPTVTGNNAAHRQAAGAAAGSVQDVLQQIADTLGGDVGGFNVSIGVRKGKYRVDPTGQGRTKAKGGVLDFGEDSQAAILAAAFDAIGDGAIKGISGAMQKALRSSPDIDKAIAEALKVRDVEDIIGGIGSVLERQLAEFETQAKDRVRIARQYGFDVVKIEARNAEDRAKLVDQILTERVGSLQELLEDLTVGDLFEGSAADRRSKLLEEIAKAKSDAEKGEDGAADRLAQLTRQLVETSRDAYGTAGSEYASDRAGAISNAEAIIAAENERIRAAQQATVDTSKALQTNNQLTNETNDILSEIRALLRGGAGVAGTSIQSGTSSVGRQAKI